MTNVYFVRHAEPDFSVHDNESRPLTEKGLRDRALVSDYLADKDVTVVASSPYRRAVDTVAAFAGLKGLEIILADGFRERRIAGAWIDDFTAYARRQWADFDYKLPGGESLREVQDRGMAALRGLLAAYPDRGIAVGTHGTALSTILRYFDPSFTYDSFAKIVGLMPWIVHFRFDGEACVSVESVDLFSR